MSCGASNDKLIDGLSIEIEVYHCELESGHIGAHKSSGHPIWWDYELPEEDLATRALRAMLPDDATKVAFDLVHLYQTVTLTEGQAATVGRAIEILRAEP